MKKIGFLFQIILVVIGALVGFRAANTLSTAAYTAEESPQLAQQESRPLAILQNGQRNILMVLVDNLSSPQPQLKSLWLILYMPQSPIVTLMPVFPSAMNVESDSNEELYQNFSITPAHSGLVLEQAFLDILAEKELTWSGYVILDEIGINNLTTSLVDPNNLFNLTNRSKSFLSLNTKITPDLFNSVADIQFILKEQGSFYNEVCWEAVRSQNPSESGIPPAVQNLIPNHLVLSFDEAVFSAEFDLLRQYGSSLLCEIPFFKMQPLQNP